jgi:hypothetical protein
MKVRFTYWRESDGRYLGYLKDYPDHWTQGETLEDPELSAAVFRVRSRQHGDTLTPH